MEGKKSDVCGPSGNTFLFISVSATADDGEGEDGKTESPCNYYFHEPGQVQGPSYSLRTST